MSLLLYAFVVLCGGSLVVLLLGKSKLTSRVGTVAVMLATALSGFVALQVLLSGATLAFSLTWAVPGGEFSLLLDPLAAFFVLPISILSFFCTLYAGPYLAHEEQSRSLAPHWFFYAIMVLAMLLVVTAANSLLFLSAWEIMTLSSFFLVAWDHHLEEVRKAAWIYLLAAHCGMMLLLALFILAGDYSGSLNFSDFGPLSQLPLATASIFYLLALFGFGVKAGLFPIHIWLPNAHPAAPSHVSALMSGVLIKTGIYGILRMLSFLPPAPAWWGWLMALLGAAGALYGISMAAQQRDIKRCLAYSTVENIGIMFLGFGFGLVAVAQGHPTIALFAYAGGMLHLWNHALFKGVMFLGAGVLLQATGSRDMNRMGGLLKKMPVAGILLIGGSLAIGALPPLNGLISEWLIYLGLSQAGISLSGFSALVPFLLIGLLGLVGALALLTFSRLIGISLLGEPRDPSIAQRHATAPAMLISMASLLAGCLAIGIYPQGALHLLTPALSSVARLPVGAELETAVAPLGQWALLLLAGLALCAGVLILLRRRGHNAQAATWGCSFRFPTARMSYTAEGFSELSAAHLMPGIMRPQLQREKIAGFFPAATNLAQTAPDPVLTRILQPLFMAIADRCQKLRWLQQGQLPIYLLYMFLLSTLLLGWSVWTGRGG